MNTVRSIGLSLQRRINEIYGAVAPIKAATDTWTLNNTPELLPTEIEVKAAVLAFEALTINPLRLNEEIDEIKAGATPPPISGQVIIGWENISGKPNLSLTGHVHDETDPWGIRQGYQAITAYFASSISLFLQGIPSDYHLEGWRVCDGTTISRTCPAGYCLETLNFPFGIGDGSTTCNLPTMTSPAGWEYRMFVGEGA